MNDVLQMIEDRWKSTEVMGGRLFDSPTGGQAEMQCLQLGFQPKRAGIDVQDYPFLVMRVRRGNSNPGMSGFTVELIAGIYINPDRDADGDIDGDDDAVTAAVEAIETVIGGFRKLALDANYFPYSLENIEWWCGDKRDGLHPSPNHFQLTAELGFQQDSVF